MYRSIPLVKKCLERPAERHDTNFKMPLSVSGILPILLRDAPI